MKTGTYSDMIDVLTYRSYAFNRRNNPNITPEQWGRLFPEWQALEARYTAAR